MAFLTGLLNSFWYRIALSVALLTAYATFVDGGGMMRELKSVRPFDIGLGVASAVLLYALFAMGFVVMKPVVEVGIGQVYAFRLEAAPESIALLLVFTSFGEEYFWRGFVQRGLSEARGTLPAVAFTTAAYTLIHMPTLNPPLIMAALILGLCWGVLYAITRSLWAVIASHIVWTELVFVLLPLI